MLGIREGLVKKLIENAAISRFLGFAISKNTNGYIKFPDIFGGLIIQWGFFNTPSTSANCTYPIAFPSACFSVIAGNEYNGSATSDINVAAKTSTYWTCRVANNTIDAYWCAFGY